MKSTMRKLAVAASLTGALAATAALPAASAAPAASPHLSPANTKISVSLTSNLVFSGQIQGIALQVTCTTLSGAGTTPASGLKVQLTTRPQFGGCTDTLGGTDTVATTGTWYVIANSTGSQLSLQIPQKGATFVSSAVQGCKLQIAPKASAKVVGSYDNVNAWTFTNSLSKLPVKGVGCSATSPATVSGAVKFSPNVSVVS